MFRIERVQEARVNQACSELFDIIEKSGCRIVQAPVRYISALINFYHTYVQFCEDENETCSNSGTLQNPQLPTIALRFDEAGGVAIFKFASEDVDLLVIDEAARHDRVYRITQRAPRCELWKLIGQSEIGSRCDPRHPAFSAVIRASSVGACHLTSVSAE